MRLLFALAAILAFRPAWANERDYQPYSNEEAFNITTGALLKHPGVEGLVKNSERIVWTQIRSIGLNEDYVRTFATIAAPLVYRKISTRDIHMRWDPIRSVTVRPDVEYYFDSQEFNFTTNLVWRFE